MIDFALCIMWVLIGLSCFLFIIYLMLDRFDENERILTEQKLQDLKHELQTYEQLLKEYESEI